MKARFIRLPELHAQLGELADELVAANARPKIKDLREHSQKKTREMHQAAVFARAVQVALEIKPGDFILGFPEEEYCAFDAILIWKKDGEVMRLNVQLKELPPVRLTVNVAIDEIVGKTIVKLGHAPDVVLAIFINRPIGPYVLGVPHHDLGGVCAFGLPGELPPAVFVIGYLGDRKIEATTPLQIEEQRSTSDIS
jgi:hypothetical protein